MRFPSCSALAAAALMLLPATTNAGIIGIAVPATIAPGSTFTVIVVSQDVVEIVRDITLVLGFFPGGSENNTALGRFLGALPLANNETNLGNVTLTLPADAPLGPAVFTSSLTSLVGNMSEPVLSSFNFNFTVGIPQTSRAVVQDY